MHSFLALASLLAGCIIVVGNDDDGPNPVDDPYPYDTACDVETWEDTVTGVAELCVEPDGVSVVVDFGVCRSSSCDPSYTSMCEASARGDGFFLDASATITHTSCTDCTDDCGFTMADCTLPDGVTGDTVLSWIDLDGQIVEGKIADLPCGMP